MDISEQIREIELQAWRELGEQRRQERERESEHTNCAYCATGEGYNHNQEIEGKA